MIVDTSEISSVNRGFPIRTSEEVFIAPDARYPDLPPTIYVGNDSRFVGYPHVICGRQLCIYLDPGREWNPTYGMAQVVDRVVGWFDNAANDRFDPRTSLFHAVGGANPVTHHSPMVVVRNAVPDAFGPTAALILRSATRVDLAWRAPTRSKGEAAVVLFNVPTFLPLGIGRNVQLVAAQVELSGGLDTNTFVNRVQRSAAAGKPGEPSYLSLVISHPTDPEAKALAVGRIPAAAADQIRLSEPTITPRETPIEWIPVSDERPTVTTRRDSSRPAAHLAGKWIELWGCGGLGSWIAELCVRAGAAKLTLRDHGARSESHLVV